MDARIKSGHDKIGETQRAPETAPFSLCSSMQLNINIDSQIGIDSGGGMDQVWFEMKDIKKKFLNKAVWIPLRSSQSLEKSGERNYPGEKEEFYGVGSLAVPHRNRKIAETFGWGDIARLIIDRMDVALLNKVAPSSSGERMGSLKSLQNVLLKRGCATAKEIMAPLFGVYDLRLADAHLPKETLESAYERMSVDRNAPPIVQGFAVIAATAAVLLEIKNQLR